MDKAKVLDYFKLDHDGAGQTALLIYTAGGYVPIGVFDDDAAANATKARVVNAMITYRHAWKSC